MVTWLVLALALITSALSRAAGVEASPTNPRYVLKLTLNEFSILNASEVDGLMKYGGSGDFQLKMAKEGNEVVWNVTIESARLMELLGIFVGEKAIKLVQGLDPNNIDPGEKIALQAIKSLSQKLEFAQKNPIWSQVKLAGVILQAGTNWAIQTTEGQMALADAGSHALANWVGRGVVAEGYVKTPGQFELTRLIDLRTNTLELFVMSQCPFGRQAEAKLYNFIESTNCLQKPKLEIHYLFYKVQKDGKDDYTSLHGEEEITEDLVQIVLRDTYPALFERYVRLRTTSGELPWQKLLSQLGATPAQTDGVEAIIKSQRDALIQNEQSYVAGRYGITDGSPSYVWESQRVTDLTRLERFKAFKDFTAETCAH